MAKISLQNIACTAKYLCPEINTNPEYCRLVNHDYKECLSFSEENVMVVNPEEIVCEDACKCKYAGKRPACVYPKAHIFCGITLNGKIPEGEIPDNLVEKVRQVIPSCRI